VLSLSRINIAELPKEKAFGEFGFLLLNTIKKSLRIKKYSYLIKKRR
jgi:hypothetical protein